MGDVRGGQDQVQAVHDFVAAFLTDETLKERVLHVFSALPEGAQKELMQDPGFSIGIYDPGRSGGTRVLMPCPQAPRGSRLVTLASSLGTRARVFAHYVIAHELAHALLWNRGRHPAEDPEIAADSVAAEWGFPRPATLPLL